MPSPTKCHSGGVRVGGGVACVRAPLGSGGGRRAAGCAEMASLTNLPPAAVWLGRRLTVALDVRPAFEAPPEEVECAVWGMPDTGTGKGLDGFQAERTGIAGIYRGSSPRKRPKCLFRRGGRWEGTGHWAAQPYLRPLWPILSERIIQKPAASNWREPKMSEARFAHLRSISASNLAQISYSRRGFSGRVPRAHDAHPRRQTVHCAVNAAMLSMLSMLRRLLPADPLDVAVKEAADEGGLSSDA